MVSLSCKCGYTCEGEDPDVVKAEMWYHAIHDHLDMLKNMSVKELAQIHREHDKKVGLVK